MTDYRFPSPGVDARFPGGGVDNYFDNGGRFVGGKDLRFEAPGIGGGGSITPAAFRSVSSVTYGSRTNTVIPAPAGIVTGDGLLIGITVAASGGAPAPTPPAGFVAVSTPTAVNDGSFFANLHVFEKRANAESGDYTLLHSTASTQAAILALSNVATTGSFVDVFSKASGTGNVTTAAGVVTTQTDELLVEFAHDWTGTGAGSPPAGLTFQLNSLLMVATGAQAVAGASGDKVFTNPNPNNAGNPWAAWLLAIKGRSS